MENCIFQLVIINIEEMKIFACQKQYPHYSAQKGWYYCIFQFKKIKFFSVQDYVFCIGWLTMAGWLAGWLLYTIVSSLLFSPVCFISSGWNRVLLSQCFFSSSPASTALLIRQNTEDVDVDKGLSQE